jgi:hypothetical protein
MMSEFEIYCNDIIVTFETVLKNSKLQSNRTFFIVNNEE